MRFGIIEDLQAPDCFEMGLVIAVRQKHETFKMIADQLTENLRQNLSVDWSERESVRAKLRLMVKRILRKYKYPPDLQDAAVELVLQQAQVMGESWVAAS